MNANQKIHQAILSKWAAVINKQSSSGLPIKEWCSLNNVSFHAYNYWKHRLKENIVDSVLPDIVPLPSLPVATPTNDAMVCPAPPVFYNSSDLYNPLYAPIRSDSVSVCIGDIRIEIGSNTSDDIILGIIKSVKTAKANGLNTYKYFEILLTEIPKRMKDKDLSFINDLMPCSSKVQKKCPNLYKKS